MNRDKIKGFSKIRALPKPFSLIFAICLCPFALPPAASSAQAEERNENAAGTDEWGAGEDEARPAGRKKIVNAELISGSLPTRKTSAGAFLAVGHVGPGGFLLGGDLFYGWRIMRFMSLHLRGGGGSVQKRSGVNMTMVHAEVTFPVRLAICSHTPRVCPGLDFYISLIPGAGYGILMQNKPFKVHNHAINAILGVSLESIRTYGNMDAGVRFGAYLFFDFLKDNEKEDPWLSYAIFELGAIIRWGKAQ
jgi:hypothetical protein